VEDSTWWRWAAGWRAWARRYPFWTHPPFGWIAYLPLLVVFVALLAVILGLGDGLGAPSLIWHDRAGTQLVAGFAVGLLGAQLAMVGYLLDSRENPNQSVAPDVATFESVATYLRWPLVILFGAVVVGFFLRYARTPHPGFVLVGPVLTAVAVVALRRGPRRGQRLIDLFAQTRHERMRRLVEHPHRLAAEPGAAPPDPGAHVVQGIVMLALAAAYVLAAIFKRHVPAAFAVSVALALAVGVWGLLRFWFRRYRLFWTVVLIVFGCSIGVTADQPVTGLAHVSFPQEGARPRELLGEAAALEAWRARFPDAKPPLVVVATSGGALRAALWTLNVLRGLEHRLPGFMSHVRLVTGASGGMVGAAHLVSALAERGPPLANLAPEWWSALMEDAAKDSLTAVTRALILPRSDRGRALEESWEEHTNGRLAMPFRELLRGEKEGWLPSLVYSPMLVEDGRRVLVSNLELGQIVESLGPRASCSAPCAQSISAIQLFACAGVGIDTIKLSTVARLSATFPWVTSAALLTTTPDRRVVDAGYYDNYGVDIATAWIRENAGWLEANTSGVLLLQIRDETTAATDVTAEPGPSRLHEWVSALSTPIEGFLAARSASMTFRNDQKVEVLAGDRRLHHAERFFVTETIEFAQKAPLEWYLNRESIDVLETPPSERLFDSVAAWWATRSSP
jgi:hypothetical protein